MMRQRLQLRSGERGGKAKQEGGRSMRSFAGLRVVSVFRLHVVDHFLLSSRVQLHEVRNDRRTIRCGLKGVDCGIECLQCFPQVLECIDPGIGKHIATWSRGFLSRWWNWFGKAWGTRLWKRCGHGARWHMRVQVCRHSPHTDRVLGRRRRGAGLLGDSPGLRRHTLRTPPLRLGSALCRLHRTTGRMHHMPQHHFR